MAQRPTFTRADRVRKELIREMSDILHNEVKHPRLEDQVISVVDVDLSADLRYAKVFVSILGDEEIQNELMTILLEAKPKIRTEVGRRIRLRYTPDIEFRLDNSLERGTRVTGLLEQISRGEIE